MQESQNRAVVITGASTGIGEACARCFAAEGFRVFAGVRKVADGGRLVADLGDCVTPLIMEVTDGASLSTAAAAVRAALGGRTLAGLVCNAGIAVSGPILHVDPVDVTHQFDVNVVGVVRTVQAFGPLLGADSTLQGPPGRIVMMSSVAGKMGMPFVGPYAASKHALEGLTKSLRKEVSLYGIGVVIIGPGAVATPIWDKADESEIEKYAHTDFVPAMKKVFKWMKSRGPAGLPPERIARRVHHAITAAKPRLRYAEVPQRFENWSLPRLLPERMVDAMVTKRLGLRPQDRG